MLDSLLSSDDRCCDADVRRVVTRHQVPLFSNPELRAATVDNAIRKHFQLQIDFDHQLLLEAVKLSE